MHLYIFGLKYLNTLSVPGFDFCEFFFPVFLKKEKKDKPEKCDSHTAYHW